MDIIESAKKKIESEITDIENRTDLSEDEKRSRTIHIFSVTCAAVAVQPIPFADIFVLTPIQAYMGVRLSAIRGMPLSEAEATDLLKEIAGIVGLGMAAQQIALGLYKVGLPGLAGFTTIPLVYGLTYAIGRVMDYYLEKKSKGQTVSKADLKNMWAGFRKEGKAQAKNVKNEVNARDKEISESNESPELESFYYEYDGLHFEHKAFFFLVAAEATFLKEGFSADDAERYVYEILTDEILNPYAFVLSLDSPYLPLQKKAEKLTEALMDKEFYYEDQGLSYEDCKLYTYRNLKEMITQSPVDVGNLLVDTFEIFENDPATG